ncbi:unnamed protein product [Brachionus calyciflorus]|uniref:Uncharacterized protein n=1 Tax=Brachionus calyciflorus TaxID=104777 RepID=A0A814FWL9_9BILA|nr:unnamed protein product [Brachionus calyciflorus]
MENEYKFLDNTFVQNSGRQNANSLSIMALNVRAFNSNKFNLRSDLGFMNSDLILLSECHNQVQYRQQAVDLLSQQGFKLVHYSWCSRPHASNGQIAYVRTGRHAERLRFMCDNSDNNTREYREKHKIVEMSLFEYKCNDLSEPLVRTNRSYNTMYIVRLYKHVDMSKRECRKQLRDFLHRHLRVYDDDDDAEDEQDFLMAARHRNAGRIKNILVVGDFNIDFNKEFECMNRMRNELNLNPMSVNECTYRRNRETTRSHLNWAFTSGNFNFDIGKSIEIYENWFSDHNSYTSPIRSKKQCTNTGIQTSQPTHAFINNNPSNNDQIIDLSEAIDEDKQLAQIPLPTPTQKSSDKENTIPLNPKDALIEKKAFEICNGDGFWSRHGTSEIRILKRPTVLIENMKNKYANSSLEQLETALNAIKIPNTDFPLMKKYLRENPCLNQTSTN